MKVNLGIWGRLTNVVIVLVILSGMVGIGVWYFPLIQKNEQTRASILQLDSELQQEAEKSKQLRASIEALRNPKTVERLAREKLFYAKPGETVIRFEQAGTDKASNLGR